MTAFKKQSIEPELECQNVRAWMFWQLVGIPAVSTTPTCCDSFYERFNERNVADKNLWQLCSLGDHTSWDSFQGRVERGNTTAWTQELWQLSRDNLLIECHSLKSLTACGRSNSFHDPLDSRNLSCASSFQHKSSINSPDTSSCHHL